MVRHIRVVPYDPAWIGLFEVEADRLRALWGDQVLAIEHIGSTSVPGLAAKPIVDMLPILRDVTWLDGWEDRMQALGYLVLGEHEIPGRRFFVKGTPELRTYHIHCFAQDGGAGSAQIARHLAFRDYMRAHPDEAHAYALLKQRLAACFPTDARGYVAGKDAFVRDRERRALAWQKEQAR